MNTQTNAVAKRAAKRAKLIAGSDRYVGAEPTVESIKTNADLVVALNWYNYSCTQKDYIPWVYKYMKDNNFSASDISAAKSLPDWKISSTSAFIFRMIANGTVIPQDIVDRAVSRITNVLATATASAAVVKETNVPVLKKVSVADRVKERISNLIGDLEEEVDRFCVNYESDFKPYDWMKKNQLGAIHAKRVAEYYAPLREELASYPDDIGLTKIKTKKFLAFVDSIIDGANSIAQVRKAVRRPRKVRLKTAASVVTKLRFLKESKEYKVASIDPLKVIGSQKLFVFNAKLRKLTVFTADSASGLTFKGASLIGFDPKTSFTRTVRKPEEILPKILASTKAKASEVFTNIKAKNQTPNGRIGPDSILLKVF